MNKKGWIKILEATVAILIISSVLIMVYSGQPKRVDIDKEVSGLQKKILMDISSDSDLRSDVLNETYGNLINYVETKMPLYLNFSLKICNLSIYTPCKINDDIFIATADKEIFVEETVISTDLIEYDPKKVRLFVWRK